MVADHVVQPNAPRFGRTEQRPVREAVADGPGLDAVALPQLGQLVEADQLVRRVGREAEETLVQHRAARSALQLVHADRQHLADCALL